MQVKGGSGNLGLLAQGGNSYLFIGCILEQLQKRILNDTFGYDGSSVCFSWFSYSSIKALVSSKFFPLDERIKQV